MAKLSGHVGGLFTHAGTLSGNVAGLSAHVGALFPNAGALFDNIFALFADAGALIGHCFTLFGIILLCSAMFSPVRQCFELFGIVGGGPIPLHYRRIQAKGMSFAFIKTGDHTSVI